MSHDVCTDAATLSRDHGMADIETEDAFLHVLAVDRKVYASFMAQDCLEPRHGPFFRMHCGLFDKARRHLPAQESPG